MPRVNEKRVSKIDINRFKEVLKESKYSQRDICEELGTTEAYLSRRIHSGTIDKLWMFEICKMLDVSPEYLSGKPSKHKKYGTPGTTRPNGGFNRRKNRFGSVQKLSGNRRKPYRAMAFVSCVWNEEKEKYEQKYEILGYFETKVQAENCLFEHNCMYEYIS